MDKLFVSFLSAISAALFLHAEHMERICLYPRLEILRRVVRVRQYRPTAVHCHHLAPHALPESAVVPVEL